MNVSEVMSRSTFSVSIPSSVREAVQLMAKKNIGSVIVVDKRKPIGILTERDVLKKIVARGMDANETDVSAIMSSPLQTITEETSVSDAASIMREKKIRRLPVVKGDQVIGMLTARDIAEAARFSLATRLRGE